MPETVTLEVPTWFARKNGLASREMTGEIIGTTERGLHFHGSAVVRESDFCLRCGREIDNPVSRLVGYGPWCSAELGIPRKFSEADVEAVRIAVQRDAVIDEWIPRSIVKVVNGELPSAAMPNGSNEKPARIEIIGRSIFALGTPYSCKDLLKSVRGARWDKERKAWYWPISETVAVDLVEKLRTSKYVSAVVVDPVITELIERAQASADAGRHKVDVETQVPDVDIAEPDGVPSHWIHQKRAFHFARGQSARMLAIGMGGGKSRVAVNLITDANDRRVLILCPKNVVGVWPKQFRLYDGSFEVVAPRKGTVAKRTTEIEQALKADGPVVVVVNYESAWREPLAKLLLGQVWDRVILDESHRIKSAKGKASNFCGRLGRVAHKRLCLTGTPMPHSPLDVYGQYRFLDPGIFGTSFVNFRSRYAVMGGYGGHEILGYQREPELSDRVYSIAYRIAEEELDAILGLEEPTHEVRNFELSPSARKTYNTFADDMFAQIKGGTVTANNVLTKILRLQQMTSGHLPVEEVNDETGLIEKHVEEIDTTKREALEDLLEDVKPGEPVIVYCRFTHDLDSIAHVAEQLGRTYGELSGRRRDALTDDSTLAPGVEIAGVQIQSGGVGIDFSAAHYCVFYSVGYSLGDYDQALKRTHRPGQTSRVSYYHLIADDTIDVAVREALAQRKDVVEYVMGLAQ